jgi:hypothetical protein
MIHPEGKAIVAVKISSDGTTTENLDRMKLSKKAFSSIALQSVKRTIGHRTVKAVVMKNGSAGRVVLIKLNKKGEADVFTKKASSKLTAAPKTKKLVTISKKQSDGTHTVSVKTTAGTMQFALNPTTWTLSAL